MPKKERGLGRGLDALFTDDDNNLNEIDIKLLKPNIGQPRKRFDESSLAELAESIQQHGLLQPLIVRPRGSKYEIVAGERRWRAAKLAGLDRINVVIKEINNQEAAEISLIENLQRDDLSVIEEARAYQNLMDKYNYTQEMIAERVGKSRPYVANVLRILNLPADILAMIDEQKISVSHARTLLALQNDDERIAAARSIIEGKISVRQTEKRVKGTKDPQLLKIKKIEIADIETRMQKYLGTKAEIISKKKGGKIEISYYSDEELERILELIGL